MRHGFSLVEMMLTLVIMAIFVAIAVPRLSSASESSRLDAAESRIVSEFYTARDMARATGQSYALEIWVDGDAIRTYQNGDRSLGSVVRKLDLAAAPYEIELTNRLVETSDKFIVVDGYGMFDANAKLTIQAGSIGRTINLDLPTAATDTAKVGGLDAGR